MIEQLKEDGGYWLDKDGYVIGRIVGNRRGGE